MMSLSPKHERAAAPIPAHPYRDSAAMYGALSIVIVVVAALTGGGLVKAVLAAAGFFAVATGWAWFRFRERIRALASEDAAKQEDL